LAKRSKKIQTVNFFANSLEETAKIFTVDFQKLFAVYQTARER
jgi:hypothetical protein